MNIPSAMTLGALYSMNLASDPRFADDGPPMHSYELSNVQELAWQFPFPENENQNEEVTELRLGVRACVLKPDGDRAYWQNPCVQVLRTNSRDGHGIQVGALWNHRELDPGKSDGIVTKWGHGPTVEFRNSYADERSLFVGYGSEALIGFRSPTYEMLDGEQVSKASAMISFGFVLDSGLVFYPIAQDLADAESDLQVDDDGKINGGADIDTPIQERIVGSTGLHFSVDLVF